MKQFRNIFTYLICILLLIVATTSRAQDTVLHTEISGIAEPALNNAKERLSILQEDYGKHLTPDTIQAFYKAAPHNLKQALEPFGYFKAEIRTRLTHQGAVWTAQFFVTPGQPLRITRINVKITGPGQFEPDLLALLNHFPLTPGQIFQADLYESAKKSLFQTANNQGYIKAALDKKEIQIDLKHYTAVIILQLDTGPRYYFGPVSFEQDSFSTDFLERFQPFHTGDNFSNQKLLKFQQNLNNSHYFQQVAINPDLNPEASYQVPINVLLKANKSQQYNAAIGYGTYTGPRLTLGANFKHLTKTGHHMNFQLKVSPVLQGLAAQYVIPGKNPLTDAYTLGANVQKFSPKNGYSNSKTLSFGYATKIQGWKTNSTLSYLHENYFIDGQNSSHNSRLLIPSLSLSRVKADDKISPRFGHKINFVLRGATTKIISNTSFVQSEIKGKYLFSPTANSTVVLGGNFGYTTVRNIRSLPLSLQFFAGGMSLRGFPYTYFGPGRYLKTGSVELRHRIVDKLSGAVFYDIGTADDHINAAMGHGTGLGLIYDSAIGPIRVYSGFGYLKNKPRHFDFEFSIGPEL
ncbi:MAG: BamA/TamA family outer membrane protein [Gammaproteobacteria bacterium]|nr:BamA/TamA family outer membrane protein [Gammaproteobacteria bacterium]